MQIHFSGTLQSASRAEGPYRRVAGAASPRDFPTTDTQQFWRAQMPGLNTIAAGFYHTVAVRADGTSTNRPSPVQVLGGAVWGAAGH